MTEEGSIFSFVQSLDSFRRRSVNFPGFFLQYSAVFPLLNFLVMHDVIFAAFPRNAIFNFNFLKMQNCVLWKNFFQTVLCDFLCFASQYDLVSCALTFQVISQGGHLMLAKHLYVHRSEHSVYMSRSTSWKKKERF